MAFFWANLGLISHHQAWHLELKKLLYQSYEPCGISFDKLCIYLVCFLHIEIFSTEFFSRDRPTDRLTFGIIEAPLPELKKKIMTKIVTIMRLPVDRPTRTKCSAATCANKLFHLKRCYSPALTDSYFLVPSSLMFSGHKTQTSYCHISVTYFLYLSFNSCFATTKYIHGPDVFYTEKNIWNNSLFSKLFHLEDF